VKSEENKIHKMAFPYATRGNPMSVLEELGLDGMTNLADEPWHPNSTGAVRIIISSTNYFLRYAPRHEDEFGKWR
jgi:hypothetical protein